MYLSVFQVYVRETYRDFFFQEPTVFPGNPVDIHQPSSLLSHRDVIVVAQMEFPSDAEEHGRICPCLEGNVETFASQSLQFPCWHCRPALYPFAAPNHPSSILIEYTYDRKIQMPCFSSAQDIIVLGGFLNT